MKPQKETTITLDTKIQASSRIYGSEISDEAVFLEPDIGMYYGLNKSGSAIWKYLKQPITISELCQILTDKYDTDSVDLESMIMEFIQEILSAKIIKIVD